MDFTTPEHHNPEPEPRLRRTRLMSFIALILIAGAALALVAGPPRLPADVPRLQQLVSMLSGSTLPIEPLAVLLVDLAWLTWMWIAGSLCLELLVVAAEAATRGAAWVRSLRGIADRLSVPLVRRVVAAAFTVQVLSRGVPLAAAQPITPAETALVYAAYRASTPQSIATVHQTASSPTYVVRAGDTLWSIAERAYGSGTAYRRVLEANVGRRMPDGQVFSARGVIQPGWELVLPDANWGLEAELDGERWYTVQPGDTLSAIARRVLGDEARWTELFELNRGVSSSDGVHVLMNPHVIWPGLRLGIPVDRSSEPTDVHAVAKQLEPTDSSATDLVAASTSSAAPGSGAEPLESRPIDDTRAAAPTEISDAPPLLRTAHALDPLVLDPADVTIAAVEVVSPADAEGSLPPNTGQPGLPGAPLALGGLGLAALAGLAVGARRLRRLRPLPQEPESEVVVQGGFAEAQLAPEFTRGLHGVGFDPVVALVGQLQQFLEEYNLGEVGIVAVRHGRSATTATLRAGLAEQAILVDLAPVFAARLEAEAEAWVSADQDVLLKLVRLRKTRLLPTADSLLDSPCLVPMGVLYDRQVYSAAWNHLGHVLIASLPGHGADTILTSLVATLTARRSPEQLHVWMIASSRALPAPVFDLPHLWRLIDPADPAALQLAAEDLRAELDWRATHPGESDLVVVVPELTSLAEHAANLELLVGRAAALGVRFVCATTCPEDALASHLMGHFGTRMVLRMQDEETSVGLLGVADAAFLGGGGRLLLRLDGREPVELYGYQVATEHLERLVRVMRSAYASGGTPTAATNTASAPPVTAESPPVEQDSPPQAPAPPESPAIADVPSAPEPRPSAEPNAKGQSDSAGEVTTSVEADPPPEASASVPRGGIPPIEVICFAGPRVLCRGQQVWPRLGGGDAKPWELLLYLACQPVEGVATEDAVEALWPGDEQPDDAPHRFRQLRYRLRRALTDVPGAPDTDGVRLDRGTLRLDPDVVCSDAQQFLTLVRKARLTPGPDAAEYLERARALYLDDLLQGADARRYTWLDERDESGVTLREHFRRLFQQASLKVAELYADAGELAGAVEVYRELTEIDPGEERLWRALFRVHAQRGDRVALVREEHRMREALLELASEIDETGAHMEEPSPETMQEYQHLLASLPEPDREPATA